jgi:hypothetical protein
MISEIPIMNRITCVFLSLGWMTTAIVRAAKPSDSGAVAAAQTAWLQKVGALAAADLDLDLPGGADNNPARLHLEWRGAAWGRAWATAPAWDAASVKESHGWYERNQQEPVRQRRETTDATRLTWDGSRLTGEVGVIWHIDATRAERMPAGMAPYMTYEGIWSPLDLFQTPPRIRERRQTYRLTAKDEGRMAVELTCVGLMEGKDMNLAAALPGRPDEIVRPRMPRFNVGFHRADVSGLAMKGDRLSGELVVLLHPDMVLPDRSVLVRMKIAASVKDGRLTGTWTATGNEAGDLGQAGDKPKGREAVPLSPIAASGRLDGRAARLVEGRWESTGDLGPAQGPVRARVSPVAAPAGILAAHDDVWIRQAAARAVAHDLRSAAGALADLVLSPSGDTSALPLSAQTLKLPSGGAAPQQWRVLGPLPWVLIDCDPITPPALPTAAPWRVTGQDAPIVWTEATLQEDGALLPPAKSQAGMCWLAACRLAAGHRQMRLSSPWPMLAWLDGRPLHRDGRPVPSGALSADLAAGEHELMVLVARENYGPLARVELDSPPVLKAVTPKSAAAAGVDGPLVVDVASGTGVVWSAVVSGLYNPRPGGSTGGGFVFGDLATPARLNDLVIVAAQPPALVALDKNTGRQRWQVTVGDGSALKCPPTSDSRNAYLGTGTGTVIAVNADGVERWRGAAGRPVRWLRAAFGAVAALTRGDREGGVLMVWDAETGAPRWKAQVPAGDHLLLFDVDGLAVVLASDLRLRALADGRDLGPLSVDAPWDHRGAWFDGGTVFEAHVFRQAAVDLRRQGELLYGVPRWRTPVFAANRSASTTLGASAGGRCFFVRRPEEFSHHDPIDALMLEWCDAVTGADTGRIKPLRRGLDVPGRPVAMKRFLYVPGFNGTAVGSNADPLGLAVVDVSARPVKVGFIAVPGLGGTPLPVDDRLIVCSGDRVVALGDDPAARERAWVAGVLANLPPLPLAADPVRLTAGPVPSPDVPVHHLWVDPVMHRNRTTIPAWQIAPGPAQPADTPPLQVAWTGVPRMREDCVWPEWNRLDGWRFPSVTHEMEVKSLPAQSGSAWLRTAIDLSQDRALVPDWDDDAVRVWAGNHRLDRRPVVFAAGRHMLTAQVFPGVVAARRPQPPTDVAAALAAKAVQPIAWPRTWTVHGPLAPGATPAAGDAGQAIAVVGDDGFVDMGRMAKGDQVMQLTASVEVSADGHLLINASADWRMAWEIGGRNVLDTRGTGNGGSHLVVSLYTVAAPVSKGTHRVTVWVQPGSKGCSLRSRAAFVPADRDRMAVAAAHPAPGGRSLAGGEDWMRIGFACLDDPTEMLSAWRRVVGQHRGHLERIVKLGGESGSQAAAMLERLTP